LNLETDGHCIAVDFNRGGKSGGGRKKEVLSGDDFVPVDVRGGGNKCGTTGTIYGASIGSKYHIVGPSGVEILIIR